MKVTYIAVLFAILSGALAVRKDYHFSQNAFIEAAIDAKVDLKNDLNPAIMNFISLAAIEETTEVLDILKEVKGDISEALVRTQADYQSEETAYNDAVAVLEARLDELAITLKTTQGKLAAALETKAGLESDIQAAQDRIVQFKKDIEAEKARRAQYIQKYEEKIAALQEADTACTEALVLMDDIKQKDSEIGQTALIQTYSSKIKMHIQNIHEKMKKIKGISFAGTMVDVLVQIGQTSVNIETINKIIVLIQDLQVSIKAEIQTSRQENVEDGEQSVATLQTLSESITVEEGNIQVFTEELALVNTSIASHEAKIKDLEGQIAKNNERLESTKENWIERSANFEKAIERLKKDLEVLEMAIGYLNSQNY